MIDKHKLRKTMANSAQKKAGFLASKTNNVKVNIKPINLGKEGIEYVKSYLTKSGPLSQAVARYFGNDGEAFTPLPEGTSLTRAKRFEAGGLMSMDAYHSWAAKYITSQWGDSMRCQLLFEDPWMKRSDIAACLPKQPYFTSGYAIYYVPQSADFNDVINAGVKEVKNFLLIGFIVRLPLSFPTSGKAVDDNYISMLAQNTHAAFISAYDQESIVMWIKK